jgi:hypothetical protein
MALTLCHQHIAGMEHLNKPHWHRMDETTSTHGDRSKHTASNARAQATVKRSVADSADASVADSADAYRLHVPTNANAPPIRSPNTDSFIVGFAHGVMEWDAASAHEPNTAGNACISAINDMSLAMGFCSTSTNEFAAPVDVSLLQVQNLNNSCNVFQCLFAIL